MFAISTNWIFESFINDESLISKRKQCITFKESLEGVIINGPIKERNKVLDNKYFMEKGKKLS